MLIQPLRRHQDGLLRKYGRGAQRKKNEGQESFHRSGIWDKLIKDFINWCCSLFLVKGTTVHKIVKQLHFFREAGTSYFAAMKAASINDIKKELQTLDPKSLRELCMRLAKYKKENKELLTYLLYEADNEQSYISVVKETVDDMFVELPSRSNLYYVKKGLRKILRFLNKQIKYSGIKQTELELRIHFCSKIQEAKIPLRDGTVLYNLYQQQLKKIYAIVLKLPEDLQLDYQREIKLIDN